MPSPLPHSAALRADVQKYISDVGKEVQGHCLKLSSAPQFRAIYKTSLATDSVLARISSRRHKPKLSATRLLARKIPYLVGVGQMSSARIEIRRLTEMTFWVVYFSDHAVEFQCFEKSPSSGISSNPDLPIEFASRREPSFYRKYAKELFRNEPSGLACEAVDTLSASYSILSESAHAGVLVRSGKFASVLDKISNSRMETFSTIHKRVCAAVCMVLAAFSSARFDRLPPVYRAWFDWLIGREAAKRLRSQRFGL